MEKIRRVVILSFILSFLFGLIGGFLSGGVLLFSQKENFLDWLNQVFYPSKIVREQEKAIVKEKITIKEEETATIRVVEKVSPSVVSIIISKDLSKIYNFTGPDIFLFPDFFEFGFPEFEAPSGKQEVGGGTGFIISEDGLILTNKHVVSDEEAEYTVILNDGKKFGAKVLARDSINDIAVVKIEAKGLPPVSLGDSDKIKIGQTVIAIGNVLSQYKNTVTKGVISGVGRRIVAGGERGREVIEQAIQTDAAINPGNSGGPLINLSGEVIGINTAIDVEGQLIGFAIPVNLAKPVIESVKKYGKIIRPFLGIRYILLNPKIAKANNLPVDYGALIVRGERREDLAVIPGSPADKAGIVENDIILELNGEKIKEGKSLAYLISKYSPGDEIELKILHRGEEKIIKVKLGQWKNE